ncbi:hypothetical protein LTR50_003900 [Elasticomyces elasticus]|nr:hypothetical protein LTR50_003900 [Elasticomyces elasticus]
MSTLLRVPQASPQTSSLKLPANKRITTPAGERLSIIMENNDPPPIPPRSALRLSAMNHLPARFWASRLGSGSSTTRSSTSTAPPPYERYVAGAGDEPLVDGPVEGEKVAALRNNRQITKRGGWKRLGAIVALVVIVAVALGVGLGVGLTRKKSNNATPSMPGAGPTTGQPTPASRAFPLGEYSMITFLDAVQTNCTSNPATWTCFPYTIYSSSANKSMATFNWVISNSTSDRSSLTISSTNNPFSISFSSIPLTHVDTGLPSERYTFNFTQSKNVIPTAALTQSNTATTCYFNNTLFSATLYLQRSRTYPSGGLADSTGVGGYTPWPYAIEISQASAGGVDVPACYEMQNAALGARITQGLAQQAGSAECRCLYKNFDP